LVIKSIGGFMKKKLLLLFLLLLLTPVLVYAKGGNSNSPLGIIMAIIVLFVIPLSLSNQEKEFADAFWPNLFVTAIVMIIVKIILGNGAYLLVFFMIITGISILWPKAIRNSETKKRLNQSIVARAANSLSNLKCKNCNASVHATDKFCTSCGATLENNTYVDKTVAISSTMFDPIYSMDDNKCLEAFLLREIEKAGIDTKTKMIAEEALKRKRVLVIILSILVFALISLVFFHFPYYTYMIGIVLIAVIFFLTNSYSYMRYLKKKVKERPGEKISNIVMLSKESLVKDNSGKIMLVGVLLAIVLSLGVFIKPRIIYEKMDDGYGVRFYAFGLTNMTKAEIPSSHKGKPVVSLRGNAFSNMPFLEEVVLSDNITEIRGQAFLNCRKLKSVKMPKKLKTLGGNSFKNCVSLKSIEFGNELEVIGGQAFDGATSLESVKLQEGLKEIGGGAFKGCTSLKSIEIPNSVRTIGGETFAGDVRLTTVKLPEGIEKLNGQMFQGCTHLDNVVIPDSVTAIGGSIFDGASNLFNIRLSSNLKEIGGGAFSNCTSLERISIPNSVTNIGGEAFMGDYNLRTISLPENLAEIRGDTFSGCTNLESIIIPDTVTRIGGHAFEGDSSLANVTIGPNSKLTEIGSSAFRRCHSLRVITIPDRTVVNQRAFKESPTRVLRYGSR